MCGFGTPRVRVRARRRTCRARENRWDTHHDIQRERELEFFLPDDLDERVAELQVRGRGVGDG